MNDPAASRHDARRDVPSNTGILLRPSRFFWNSLQSYLLVCLVLSSAYLMVAAGLAGAFSVVAGIAGLWIVMLDWTPMPGLLRQVAGTLLVSARGMEETISDRVPVLLRVCGAALMLWAIMTAHG